ncbi:MAG: hypothetical protein ACREQL_13710 [Candidatus Binatia bacterium]
MFGLRSLAVLILVAGHALAADPRVTCLKESGAAATRCLSTTMHSGMAASLDEARVRAACDEETSLALGYLGADDVVLRLQDACNDFAASFVQLATSVEPRRAQCQHAITAAVGTLRKKTIEWFGKACFLREAKGGTCRRRTRDHATFVLWDKAGGRIVRRCGYGGVRGSVSLVFTLARHFAQFVVVGGTRDVTTRFEPEQLRPFQLLPAGAPVVGLAAVTGAGHFTFTDVCEVPRNLVDFIGGFGEACTPWHLPWRHAHDIIDYLALNFFDATLQGDAEALARLAPSALASIDDLDYQSK